MTQNKKFKRLVRARAAKTGESYATAYRHLRAPTTEESPMTNTEIPGSDAPEAEVELFACSFCGKSQKQVKKLIAGPGTYICDECVALCAEIISDESEGELKPTDEQQAAAWSAMLKSKGAAARATEESLEKMVRQARAKGISWSQIAASLGISAAEAQERFSAESS